MNILQKRKSTRLSYYDYSTNGAYFITICTQDKKKILSTVGDGILDIPNIKLTRYGYIIKDTIEYINKNNEYINIEKYAIMPNHIHMIICILNGAYGNQHPTDKTNKIIPKVISSLKRYVNKSSKESIFQRSYHDHIIRNEEDYRNIWNYIDTNPIRWEKDCFYC